MKVSSGYLFRAALFSGILLGIAPANAVLTQIDFGNSASIDLTTAFHGSQYPTQGGSTVTVNGVDFKLPTCVGCVAAIAQTPGNANLGLQNSSPGVTGHPGIIGSLGNTGPLTAPPITFAPIVGATMVYALVNSFFGTLTDPPSTVGSMTFVSESGFSFKYSLLEGINVRDHYHGAFNNVIDQSNLLGTAVFNNGVVDPNGDPDAPGTVRLDALRILLPLEFLTDPLVQIVLATEGNQGNGLPFWAAAVTVENAGPVETPIPATWLLMASGLGGLWVTMRRKGKSRAGPEAATS
jgi:hypothetical protein